MNSCLVVSPARFPQGFCCWGGTAGGPFPLFLSFLPLQSSPCRTSPCCHGNTGRADPCNRGMQAGKRRERERGRERRKRERSRGIHSSISVIYREEGVPPQVHLSGKIDSKDMLASREHIICLLGLVFLHFHPFFFFCMVVEASLFSLACILPRN